MIDLSPTTDRVRAVAAAIRDDQLEVPTPTGASVSALLHHLLGLAVAFKDAAGKLDGPTTSTPPGPVSGPLPDDWRSLLDARLSELARAWTNPAAWSGMTKAGGVALPGEVCGLVAMNEVLLHGWDLARATRQGYDVPDAEAEAVLPVVTPGEGDPSGADHGELFGPVVDVPATAPAFDRVLGLAGRDPEWTRPPVRRFDHVGITVADLDSATAFFVGLGLEVAGRMFVEGEFLDTVIGIPDSRTEIVMLQLPGGGTRLELSSFVRPDYEPGAPAAMANALGLRNVAFEVDDLQATVDRLAADGYGLVGGVDQYEHSWRMAYVRGPDGIIVSLAERIG